MLPRMLHDTINFTIRVMCLFHFFVHVWHHVIRWFCIFWRNSFSCLCKSTSTCFVMLYDAIHLVICVTTFSGTIHLVVSDTIHFVICVTFFWHDSFSYWFGCLRGGGALIDVAPGLVDNFGIRTGPCAFSVISHRRSGVNMCVYICSQIYFCCMCTRGSSSTQASQCPTPGYPTPRSPPAPPHPTPTVWGWELGWGIGVGWGTWRTLCVYDASSLALATVIRTEAKGLFAEPYVTQSACMNKSWIFHQFSVMYFWDHFAAEGTHFFMPSRNSQEIHAKFTHGFTQPFAEIHAKIHASYW